jgi:hypothetical protein
MCASMIRDALNLTLVEKCNFANYLLQLFLGAWTVVNIILSIFAK